MNKMKMIGLTLTSLLALAATGCSEGEKSKSFYITNEDARTEKLKYCDEDSERASEQNCVFAFEARSHLYKKTMSGNGLKIDYASAEKKKD